MRIKRLGLRAKDLSFHPRKMGEKFYPLRTIEPDFNLPDMYLTYR